VGLRPAPGPTRGSRAWDPHPGSVARGDPFAPLRSLAGAPCAPTVDTNWDGE